MDMVKAAHTAKLLTHYKIVFPAAAMFLLSLSCCPSGSWQDNFGVTYQLLTIPLPDEDGGLPIIGVADTGDLGCGLWEVKGVSLATIPDKSVELTIENPNRDPEDRCCYSYQFIGHLEGSGCLFIRGRFEQNDGKCTQSGDMYLYNLR